MSESVRPYNFEHFDRGHVIEDAERTLQGAGVAPGELAPDFVLPAVDGTTFQLSAHRDRPLLLRFASYT